MDASASDRQGRVSGLTLTLGVLLAGLGLAGQPALADGQATPSTEKVIIGERTERWEVPQRQMDEGATFLYDNMDPGVPHNVTSKATGPDGSPLFQSRTFKGRTQDRPVTGTEYLPAGTYGFYCTIHPFTTGNGELTVRRFGAGPVPRPGARVVIVSRRLADVVRTGRLTVEVRGAAPTPAKVELVARRGKMLLAERRRLPLESGQWRMVGIKLTRRARKLLARANRATVTVAGRVEFGSPSRATKRLR